MCFRNSRILKVFALLVFSFELVASVILSRVSVTDEVPLSGKFVFEVRLNQGINFLSFLFCEESGEEERETKGEPILDFAEFFNLAEQYALVDLESQQVKITHSIVRYSSQPALFKRICTLVI